MSSMYALDLKWLLFGLVALVFAAALAALAIERYVRGRRQSRSFFDSAGMAAAFERAPLGVMVLEELHACRYANPAARRLLGLAESPPRLPDADWVTLLSEDRAAARQEAATTGRYRSVPLGADQYVRWWVTGLDRLDLVLILDAAPVAADQANRFLLGDLAHELRTPLATLLTHLEVLRLAQIPEETRRQSVRLMQEEAQRMTRLVHNLLELGRLQTISEIERRPVDLGALAQGAIAQMMPLSQERRIPVSLQTDTPLPLAVGDADRLRQVFINLLDNAVKYSRPGDRVSVSLNADAARENIVCQVLDSGPGIPAEHLPNITRRFYRGVSEQVGGSGLGLALVEEILRRHQSRLEITSRTDGDATGTCIRFSLPAVVEREPA